MNRHPSSSTASRPGHPLTPRQSATLKAIGFILATLAATGVLVAAGLAEEPAPSAVASSR